MVPGGTAQAGSSSSIRPPNPAPESNSATNRPSFGASGKVQLSAMSRPRRNQLACPPHTRKWHGVHGRVSRLSKDRSIVSSAPSAVQSSVRPRSDAERSARLTAASRNTSRAPASAAVLTLPPCPRSNSESRHVPGPVSSAVRNWTSSHPASVSRSAAFPPARTAASERLANASAGAAISIRPAWSQRPAGPACGKPLPVHGARAIKPLRAPARWF